MNKTQNRLVVTNYLEGESFEFAHEQYGPQSYSGYSACRYHVEFEYTDCEDGASDGDIVLQNPNEPEMWMFVSVPKAVRTVCGSPPITDEQKVILHQSIAEMVLQLYTSGLSKNLW